MIKQPKQDILIPGKLYRTKKEFYANNVITSYFLLKSGTILLLLKQNIVTPFKIITEFLYISKEINVVFGVHENEDLHKHIDSFIEKLET